LEATMQAWMERLRRVTALGGEYVWRLNSGSIVWFHGWIVL
jgi:hypothetical protein